MNQVWLTLIGTLIGALAGVGGAWLSVSLQGKAEQKKWLREQKKMAYSNLYGVSSPQLAANTSLILLLICRSLLREKFIALKSLSAATIIPVGTERAEIAKWFQRLVEIRETLIVLQVNASHGQDRLAQCSNNLLRTIDDNQFPFVVTDAASLSVSGDDTSLVVIMGIHKIDAKIRESLDEITEVAKLDLGHSIKV